MTVFWFLSWVEQVNGIWHSIQASTRVRALNLIEVIPHDIRVVPIDPANGNLDLTDADLAHCDIAVFGKVSTEVLPMVDALKDRNIPVILDICDSVDGQLFTHYAHVLRKADLIVASSVYIQKQMASLGLTTTLIADAQPGVPAPFKPPQGETLRLLWYGVNDNIVPVRQVIGELASRFSGRIGLEIVTNVNDFLLGKLTPLIDQYGGDMEIVIRQWSLEEMDTALSGCDVVIIPSSELAFHQAKTANRVMTAIWAGKSCVAYPLPSYSEFADYVELNANIADGLEALLLRPMPERADMISAGQAYIAEHHSVSVRARQWQDVMEDVMQYKDDAGLRLNIGCGDKILPGYINVDIVDERSGNQPDVQCDIRNLDVFEDNAADEILSVHVIEHFYYWEVHDVLKGWVRVLKPGGQMVIECPNLLSACQEVIKNPDLAAMPGKEGQRSMWVFYGDPSWKDPLMCHKWLYTPQSLARLMMDCGLVEVKQTPARFKLREPRDMRLVAIKPFKKTGV